MNTASRISRQIWLVRGGILLVLLMGLFLVLGLPERPSAAAQVSPPSAKSSDTAITSGAGDTSVVPVRWDLFANITPNDTISTRWRTTLHDQAIALLQRNPWPYQSTDGTGLYNQVWQNGTWVTLGCSQGDGGMGPEALGLAVAI